MAGSAGADLFIIGVFVGPPGIAGDGVPDAYQALENADAALVCTEWDVFRKLDWDRAGKAMARKLVIDGRNLYTPQAMREKGFEYYSFGRE